MKDLLRQKMQAGCIGGWAAPGCSPGHHNPAKLQIREICTDTPHLPSLSYWSLPGRLGSARLVAAESSSTTAVATPGLGGGASRLHAAVRIDKTFLSVNEGMFWAASSGLPNWLLMTPPHQLMLHRETWHQPSLQGEQTVGLERST